MTMNMQKRQRIALWTVRLFGIASVLLMTLFFSGACPRWFVGRGDLFRLTSVMQFEELVAEPYHVDESVQTAPLDSDMLSVAGLGKVAAVDYIDIQGSPKRLFALAAARAAAKRPFPKVIVLECVERNFFANLGQHTIFDYGNVAPWDEGLGTSSTVKRLRRRAFLEAPGTVDFKLRRFPPVAIIRKWNDTWRDLVRRYSNYVRHPVQMMVTRSRELPKPEDAGDDYPALPLSRAHAPASYSPKTWLGLSGYRRWNPSTGPC